MASGSKRKKIKRPTKKIKSKKIPPGPSLEPLRGVWDWEKVEDLEVLIAPAGGKFGGSSVIGLTWRGGTFAEFYRKVSASPPPRPPPIIFFKPFTSDLASPHARTYILTPTSFSVSLSWFPSQTPSAGAGLWAGAGGPGGRLCGCPAPRAPPRWVQRAPFSACAGGKHPERPGKPAPLGLSSPQRARLVAKRRKREMTRGAALQAHPNFDPPQHTPHSQ